MMARVYLDYNATAPLRQEARDAMLQAMDVIGNPSSVHAEGRAAKALVERARGQVANLVGCEKEQIIFTSGATEAAATVLQSGGCHEVGCAETEHDCIINNIPPLYEVRPNTDSSDPARFVLPIDANGQILDLTKEDFARSDIACFAKQRRWPSDLNAVCAANGEIGVLNDISRFYFGEQADGLLCDITQYLGRLPIPSEWHARHASTDRRMPEGVPFVHYMICSAHKLGGPKGVGAIVNNSNPTIDISLIKGGGQELGRRSGTENIIGIAGFGAAAEAAGRDLENGVWDRVAELRKILEKALESEVGRFRDQRGVGLLQRQGQSQPGLAGDGV